MKKIIAWLCALLMLLSLVPAAAFAEGIGDAVLTVCANSDAGLGGDVNVTFKLTGGQWTGTLYLPGSADASQLCFSWGNDVAVEGYESGTAPVAANGQSVSYALTVGGQSSVVTVKTMQGSANVEGMFFTVDESLGTIAAMYADMEHETKCFGQISFGGDVHDMCVKGRGNSTWTYDFDKKPLNITIYKDENPDKGIGKYDKKDSVRFIDGVKAKKWSLLANAKDSSLLRNKLGYDLACALGVGLESRFVDVWMNGEYIGNFLLTPKTDYDAPENGYQIEIDNKVDNSDPQFTLPNFDGSSKKTYFTVKANDAGAETEDIKAYLQKAADAIFDHSSSDYLNYIDLDSWAKVYLLNEFYKDIDVVSGSKYMYRNGLADTDKLFAGPVWDLDGTFGRTYPNGYTGMRSVDEITTDGWHIDNITAVAWLQELGKHVDFMERVYELYTEYKDIFEALPDEITKQEELIADSAAMNFDICNVNQTVEKYFNVIGQPKTVGSGDYQVTYKVTNSWSDYVYNLRLYVDARLKFLSDTLTPVAPTGSISGRTEIALGENISLTANIDKVGVAGYQWQSSADGESWTDIPGAADKTYSTVMTADMDGMLFRCVVTNAPVIQTVRVAKAPIPAAKAALDPVSVELHEHSYTEKVIEPTCTKGGYTLHSCTCGHSYTDSETEALGHDYQNGRCSRCGQNEPGTSLFTRIANAISSFINSILDFFARLFSFGR